MFKFHRGAVVPFLLGAAVLLLLQIPWLRVEHPWLLRSAAAAIWVWGGVMLLNTPQALVSPGFIIAGIALWFFSLVPAAVTQWMIGSPTGMPPGARPDDLPNNAVGQMALRAIGSDAEWLCLSFSVALSALVALMVRAPGPSPHPAGGPSVTMRRVVLGVALGSSLGILLTKSPWLPSSSLAGPAEIVLLPLAGAAMAWASWWAVDSPRTNFRLFAAIATIVGLALAGGMAKQGVLLLAANTILILCAATLPSGRKLAIGAVLLLGAVGLITVSGIVRGYLLEQEQSPARRMAHWLTSKLALRQAETLYCLAFAAEGRADGHQDLAAAGPAYLVIGLVPRALWPEKPSLSRGHAYAETYCGWKPEDFGGSNAHSASVTLIGEAFIYGGPHGGWVVLGLLAAGLAWISRLFARHRAAGVMILGLAPWLLDFDQGLSMYLANGVKFLLIALPLHLVMLRLQRRSSMTAKGSNL